MTNVTDNHAVMITTTDNPWNPFTQYSEWLAHDEYLGYYSTGLLARYVITSNDLSDADQESAILEGINELIKENPFGIYKKVTPSDY